MRAGEKTTRAPVVAIATALIVVLSGGLAGAVVPTTPSSPRGAGLRTVPIGGTFDQPVFVAFSPGDSKTAYVVEQDGLVKVVRGGKQRTRPFIDLTGETSANGERGLLGLAFHPRYERNRRVYAYYTDEEGDIHVDEFRRARRKPFLASEASRRVVIEIPHRGFSNHNGGTVAFGPRARMYLATGDGGGAGDLAENAQNLDSLLGKLLRIDPRRSGERPYTVPRGNPYVGEPGRDEIYASGLRNPFRFSIDTGGAKALIAIGDVGQDLWEEVDLETLAEARGANYGWDAFEGRDTFDAPLDNEASVSAAEHHPPMHVYSSGPEASTSSVTGGVIIRDRGLPSLLGRYVFADVSEGKLFSFRPRLEANEAGGVSDTGLLLTAPVAFNAAPNGQLYVVSYAGEVSRIEERAPGRDAKRGGGVELDRIAGGFDEPVYVAAAPGEPDLLFVVEQGGDVEVVKRGRNLPGSFLGISDQVRSGGEEGLLSIAFHPRYERNRRFFVYFTNNQGNIEVDGYRTRAGNRLKANGGSRRLVIEIGHPGQSNHNGGTVAFGPGGFMYLGTGDGGSAGDPNENAQNRDSLLGKLLRIRPTAGKSPYAIPDSNPFVGRDGRDEIYALGLRNPFRFSFDRRRILIGDVGQDAIEEIDFTKLTGARGANYGWDAFEGNQRFDESTPVPREHERPILTYDHSEGQSVVAGVVFRDRRIRSLSGRAIYSDFYTGRLRTFVPRTTGARNDRSLGLSVSGPAGFGTDHRGRVYVVSLFDGDLFRIDPR